MAASRCSEVRGHFEFLSVDGKKDIIIKIKSTTVPFVHHNLNIQLSNHN